MLLLDGSFKAGAGAVEDDWNNDVLKNWCDDGSEVKRLACGRGVNEDDEWSFDDFLRIDCGGGLEEVMVLILVSGHCFHFITRVKTDSSLRQPFHTIPT